MEYKNKKTILLFGTTESTTLATAKTNAALGFACQITNTTMPKATRSETTKDARLCPTDDTFKRKDTDDPEYSEGSITGVADKGDAGYDATMAALKTAFWADSKGTFLMKHPDGSTEQWANIKLLEANDDPEGASADEVVFTIRFQLHTKLSKV